MHALWLRRFMGFDWKINYTFNAIWSARAFKMSANDFISIYFFKKTKCLNVGGPSIEPIPINFLCWMTFSLNTVKWDHIIKYIPISEHISMCEYQNEPGCSLSGSYISFHIIFREFTERSNNLTQPDSIPSLEFHSRNAE